MFLKLHLDMIKIRIISNLNSRKTINIDYFATKQVLHFLAGTDLSGQNYGQSNNPTLFKINV